MFQYCAIKIMFINFSFCLEILYKFYTFYFYTYFIFPLAPSVFSNSKLLVNMAASMALVLRRLSISQLLKSRCCFTPKNQLNANFSLSTVYSRSSLHRQEVVPSESERKEVDKLFSDALIGKINNQIESNKQGRLFAVVYICGQQFKVTNEDLIVVEEEFIPEIGESLQLTKVILVGGSDFTLIGRPLLNPNLVKVNVTVVEKTLSHLVTDFYYRKRSSYSRMRLTRLPHTMLRINNISIEGDSKSPDKTYEIMEHARFVCLKLNKSIRWNWSQLKYDIRCSSSKPLAGKMIAIRREDSSVWERRAPLSPSNVRQLIKQGCKVLVQPSNRRAYPMQAYANAGAIIQEEINDAPVIVGVKQVPIDLLIPDKTYCFFSHTIKAQDANMPLLDAILEKNIRLIDYEKMVDSKGQRVVAFGIWAGVAGMINILHGLGLRLLALGHHTPFMHIGPAHNYRTSGMARQAIRDAGYEIALGMMPKSIGPLTFVFTGSGNVSQGAQELFQDLPHEFVPPEMLKKAAEHGATNKVYACSVSRADHVVRKDGKEFDPVDYDENPNEYFSTFSKKIAPYASVIVNGIYWAPNSPRLITIPDAKYLLRPASTPWLPINMGSPPLPHRLLAICDISADPGGSIEFMIECTTIDTPFCLYDADQHRNTESFAGPGVLVCSIDNMPTQLPLQATDDFGELLFPYIDDILNSDATIPLSEEKFNPVVYGAVIASNGKLTSNFEYIQDLRNARFLKMKPSTGSGKNVLVLGAGFVAPPAIEYLSRHEDINVTLASNIKEEADKLARNFNNVDPVLLDVLDRPNHMEDLIKKADVVIRQLEKKILLPYTLHHKVAACCIKNKINMVTASYRNPQIMELNQAAIDAGISIVNEVGLDPGIDHLLAVEAFDDVRLNGGKVESFVSYCGALPSPECANNPLRYKFSWSPRGVLMAALNSAVYKKDGKKIEVPGEGGLLEHPFDVDFFPAFNLECFPNRDSLIYSELYKIPEANTVLRGTLRYKVGFATAMKSFVQLGLLSVKPHPALHPKGPDITWKKLMCQLLNIHDDNLFLDNLKAILLERLNKDMEKFNSISELGLMSDDLISKKNTPLDTLCHYLANRLAFEPLENDIVVLHTEIGIVWPDQRREIRNIDLVCYGDSKGYSAMAKTVGFPSGIVAKMLLDGEIQQKGAIIPLTPDLYSPLLKRLKQEGITPYMRSRRVHRREWLTMTEHQDEISKGNVVNDFGTIGIIFQNKLLKIVEELRLKRETDVENELKIKILRAEKYDLENRIEKSISENESTNEKIEQLENKYKKIYERKWMSSEEEKNQFALLNQRLNQELDCLKEETRGLEFEKLGLLKTLRDIENQLKIESSTRQKFVSQMVQINEEIQTVKQYQNDLTIAQNRIENYAAKTTEYVTQLQIALKHDNCLLNGLKSERCKLSEELLKTRYDLMKSGMNSGTETELKEKNDQLELELQFKKNELELLQSQVKNIKEGQDKMSSAIYEATFLMNKYLNATIIANKNEEMWKEQFEMQKAQIEFQKNQIQIFTEKSYQAVETQTDVAHFVEIDEIEILMKPRKNICHSITTMRCTIPEISWHNRDPVLSLDFQYQDERIRRLATGGTDSHVLIWLVNIAANGQIEVDFVSDLARHNKAVNIVRFSPDGKTLATGDDEAVIWLWKLSEKGMQDMFMDDSESENKEYWRPLRSLRTHVQDICDICWSPDGRFLISGSVDNTAILWNVQKGRLVKILSDHKGFVQGVAWDPRNEFLATLSSDRSCLVYNIKSEKVISRVHKLNIPNPSEPTQQKQVRMFCDDTLKSFCRRLTFTPDGEFLITPAGQLELDDEESINVAYVFTRNSVKRPVLYLPTGDKCAVAVRCCPVLFQLRSIDKSKINEKFTSTIKTDSNDNSNEKFTLFDLPYRVVFAVATLNSILLYDTQQPLPFAHVSNLHYTRLSDISWSHDGAVLAASSTDGYCSFISFKEGELGIPYTKIEAHAEPMSTKTIDEEIKKKKKGHFLLLDYC
uniref:Uncharacterized protein n=1 Tax=Strigamia maritima TaxID=126957 RepID=T1IMQ8_STRMM